MDNVTIVVDGYNFIGTMWGLDPQKLRQLRERLVSLLSKYNKYKGIELIVVFDSRDDVFVWDRGLVAGVKVKFSHPLNADDWIVAKLPSFKGRIGVVTDDRLLRKRVQKLGGIWISCNSFNDAMESYSRQREHMVQQQEQAEKSEDTSGQPEDYHKKASDGLSDRDVWEMFLRQSNVQKIKKRFDKQIDQPVYDNSQYKPKGAEIIEKFTRVTNEVIKEKQQGMKEEDHNKALRREEYYRRRQFELLRFLRKV